MKKIINLAVFLDGTWNTVESDTNVKKMKQNVLVETNYNFEKESQEYYTLAHYEEGPGTTAGMNIAGGAFAVDLRTAIGNAYEWLSKHYINYVVDDDIFPRIYIFGFSRGGYSAHVLSWLLSEIGIPKNFSICKEIAYDYIAKKKCVFSKKDFYPVTIQMLGVWDIVSAPVDIIADFHDKEKAPCVKKIFHAMAADEKRTLFPVMKYNAHSEIKQILFSGVHIDIGGGYSDDTRLSDWCWFWMETQARSMDLAFKEHHEDLTHYDFSGIIIHDESPTGEPCRIFENEPLHSSLHARLSTSYSPQLLNFENPETC